MINHAFVGQCMVDGVVLGVYVCLVVVVCGVMYRWEMVHV